MVAAGEESLVAAYLLNMRTDQEHWFTPSLKDGEEKPTILEFPESLFDGMRARPEYRAKKEADATSYAWDKVIEQFIHLGDPTLAGPDFSQTNQETEKALRIMASESRFRRRLLVSELRGALLKVVDKPGVRLARTFTAKEAADRVYIFLIAPRLNAETYEDYRRHRIAVLHAYCRCAKLKFPRATTFVGIGLDHPAKQHTGSSEDLYVYECAELTEKARLETEKFRRELGLLPDTLEPQHRHEDEFPSPPAGEYAIVEGSPMRVDARARDRRRKNKTRMVKESRRRNRRKK